MAGYEAMYGLAPANYSMPGSPAGLARIDALFGIKMYTSTFTAAPLVFGAMPSLHAGHATMEALFMSYVFPRGKWFFFTYVMWIWWATLYLQHHYAVDLIAGSTRKLEAAPPSLPPCADGGAKVAGCVFYIAKTKFLARLQPDKEFRWDYDYLEIGSGSGTERFDYGLGLTDFGDNYHSEDDEWTVGSSSGISSGCRSPVSPSDDIHSVWSSASETLAATSEVDSSEVFLADDDR